MKTLIHLSSLLALGFALSLQAADSGPYFKFDAGLALQQDVTIKNDEGIAVFLTSIGAPPDSKVRFRFDPGARFSLAGGYNFDSGVGVEFVNGLYFNNV